MNKESPVVAVLGAGSWGTACACVLAHHAAQVRLWARDESAARIMQSERCNTTYLPGCQFPSHLTVDHVFDRVIDQATHILIAVPSHAFSGLLDQLRPLLRNKKVFLASATKGLDPKSHQMLHQVVALKLGPDQPFAVLSGPSFAAEVAAKLPTAVALAAEFQDSHDAWLPLFSTPTFRVYPTQDVIGVQLCGVMKNIFAIAAGIADGLGLGANARSALITRALAELARLLEALGGQQSTVWGLAGLGDVVLSCTDNQSRNRRFGLALACPVEEDESQKEKGQVVEGMCNIKQLMALASTYAVELPITEQVYQVLVEGVDPKQAVVQLMERAVPSYP